MRNHKDVYTCRPRCYTSNIGNIYVVAYFGYFWCPDFVCMFDVCV